VIRLSLIKKSQPNIGAFDWRVLAKMAQADVINSIHPSPEKHKSHDRKRLWLFILFFGGARVLGKNILLRTDELWMTWANRLAEQAGRSRAELLRDLVYLMVFDDELGQALCQRLKSDQISYNK